MLTCHTDRPLHRTARVGPADGVRPSIITMILSSPQLRRFVRRRLGEARGGKTLDRPQLASAFNTLCDRLQQRLQPLFGTSAVTALFARALHVATVEFPWLADVIGKNGDGCSANII